MAQLGNPYPVIIQTGDTVEIPVRFTNFLKELADPTGLSIKIYVRSTREILTTATPTKVSTGVYRYYYVVPTEEYGTLVYEFSGTLDGLPVVIRGLLPVEWV